MSDIPEHDWKYLQRIKSELLEELSRRICDEISGVLSAPDLTANEKRRKIYEIVHDGDTVVAACFDDWRRGEAYLRCLALRREGLLKPDHLANLTPESQSTVKGLEEL